MGDLAGFNAPKAGALFFTLVLVAGSIYTLLLLLSSLEKIKVAASTPRIPSKRIGWAIRLLIIGFIIYVAKTGLFIAGSEERGGTAASALWVLFNVDALFFVYYATCRETREFKLNLFLWSLSFLQRGWFAYLFFVVGMESLRLIRQKRLFRFNTLLLIALLIVAYPALDLLKVYLRGSEYITVDAAMAYVNLELSSSSLGWKEMLVLSVEKVIGRIQVLSHAQIISENAYIFQQVFPYKPNPFWNEGIVGIIIDRLFGVERGAESGQALAAFIAPQLGGSWNVNPSVIGWLHMHIEVLPLALIYLLGLCVLSALLQKRLNDTKGAFDRLWFIWLILIVPGWIAQFVSFVMAQFLFFLVARVLASTKRSPKVTVALG